MLAARFGDARRRTNKVVFAIGILAALFLLKIDLGKPGQALFLVVGTLVAAVVMRLGLKFVVAPVLGWMFSPVTRLVDRIVTAVRGPIHAADPNQHSPLRNLRDWHDEGESPREAGSAQPRPASDVEVVEGRIVSDFEFRNSFRG